MFNLIQSFLTKKAILDVYIQDGYLLVRHTDNGVETDYRLLDKHQDKLLSYKTLSGALKYAQANDSTKYYEQAKQITQEVIAEVNAELFSPCLEPALTDEGQPQTAESTPQDKTVSNGVPVSDGFLVECSYCGMQLGVEDSPIPDVLCPDCYENEHREEIGIGYAERHCEKCNKLHEYCACYSQPTPFPLFQRFSYDDLMIIRLCTSDRLEKLYKDAPYCNYANQGMIDEIITFRSRIDEMLGNPELLSKLPVDDDIPPFLVDGV